MNYRLIRAKLQEYTVLLKAFSDIGIPNKFLENCRDTMKLEDYELFMVLIDMTNEVYTNFASPFRKLPRA